MEKDTIKVVFDRFLNGTSSREDLETLLSFFQDEENNSLKQLIRNELEKEDNIDYSASRLDISKRVFDSLTNKRNFGSRTTSGPVEVGFKQKSLLKNLPSVAASIFLAGIVGLLWIFADSFPRNSNDIILPDQNEATILFDDGQSLSLLKSDRKLLFNRGIEIVSLPNNEIAFQIHSNPKIPSQRQTFSSQKGTVSRLILSDGTQIWLNSATTVTYPTTFPKSERRIAITGEAYLEVTRNAYMPFIVDAHGTHVRVLGTAFNIATNVNEDYVLTTLLHGSIEVGTANQKLILTPGMQSISHKNNGTILTNDVKSTDEIAWKSGLFKFNNDDVYTILDKIKTWYDIEDYEVKSTTDDRFSGTVKRTRKLSELLENLEKISGYKFKIIDRRVIAMK